MRCFMENIAVKQYMKAAVPMESAMNERNDRILCERISLTPLLRASVSCIYSYLSASIGSSRDAVIAG